MTWVKILPNYPNTCRPSIGPRLIHSLVYLYTLSFALTNSHCVMNLTINDPFSISRSRCRKELALRHAKGHRSFPAAKPFQITRQITNTCPLPTTCIYKLREFWVVASQNEDCFRGNHRSLVIFSPWHWTSWRGTRPAGWIGTALMPLRWDLRGVCCVAEKLANVWGLCNFRVGCFAQNFVVFGRRAIFSSISFSFPGRSRRRELSIGKRTSCWLTADYCSCRMADSCLA